MRAKNARILVTTSVLSLVFVWGCNGPDVATNAAPVSANDYGMMNQCLSASASIVGFSDTEVDFSGNGTLKGSVVLLGHSTLTLTGNAQVSDQVLTPSQDQVTLHGHPSIGTIVEKDLTPAESAVLQFAANLDSLVPTQTLDSIHDSMVLNGNGGLNVIQINGEIALSGDRVLTLNGGAHDLFLINVADNVSLSGHGGIVVSGGMQPSSVLFRLTQDGSKFSISGNGTVQGTFFAPRGSAQISGNGSIQGSIFAWNKIQITGNGVTFSAAPFCPGAFLPAPSPSPSPSDSVTPTPTPTDSASPTPSPTDSTTPAPSPSPTDSVTPAPSPSPTDSTTPAPSPSPSPSASSATVTPTPTPSPSSTCTGTFCGGGILGA